MSSVITILIRRMKPKIRGGGAEGEVSRIQEQTGSSPLTLASLFTDRFIIDMISSCLIIVATINR